MERLKSGVPTILNVDDREVNRYIRTQTLRGAGYRIVEAGTGAEALRLFRDESPQLVLLDMNLPDMDGVDICRIIKASPGFCSTIVLHISASLTSVQDRVQGLEGGADGYLVEPVEPELLLATVRSMLRLWMAETRLEESLTMSRELAARYQSLIEAVPHVIFTTRADGECDYVNEQFATYTGRHPKEAFGNGWTNLAHPEDRERAALLWAGSIRTGEPFETEYRFWHADGTWRWNLSRARPVRNAAGAVVQWVGSVTDVHERKMLDEAVRLRHEEFVALAEHSPDSIARLDTELRYLYLNRVLPGMCGATREEYIGKTNRELGWPAGICDVREENCRQVLATGKPVAFEFQHTGPDGRTAYYQARLVPEFRAGEVEALLSITTDVTERREAELAVAESERRLRRLVESNVIGVVIGDNERITYANDVFLEMLGYSRQDPESGELRWRALTPPEYLPLDERCIEELKERGACAPFEKEYWRRDGTRVPILIGAAALDNAATEWACFVLDLTGLKNAEDALRRTNLALQRSNTDLAQFAYAASHDLQEPLRAVGIYTQLLSRESVAAISPEASRHLGLILAAVRRMQTLITNLLAFSQAQSAEFRFAGPVPAGDMVQGATENLKNAMEESGAVLTWRDLPPIPADASQFTLVFQNLISNSIKYRRADVQPRIDISAEREGNSWVFAVRDNGMGFEQAQAERIFSPFTRLHGRELPGTGIGLAIVQKVIERHGGQVWAEGQPGAGATFFFRLPAH